MSAKVYRIPFKLNRVAEEEIQEMEKKREMNRKIRQAKHEEFLKKVSFVFRLNQ